MVVERSIKNLLLLVLAVVIVALLWKNIVVPGRIGYLRNCVLLTKRFTGNQIDRNEKPSGAVWMSTLFISDGKSTEDSYKPTKLARTLYIIYKQATKIRGY